VILSAASSAYGAAASWRRRWYARDPARQRRLTKPVISVGNLSTGGAGKTPIVEHIARLLLSSGHRPAILTRGYGRTAPADGVTVVSDGVAVRAPLAEAGDEPLMLARALPEVPVLVGADRYLSGRFAEDRFGATLHILDDGFQHLQLARDLDLLVATGSDLTDRVLPAGRLREPLTAAAAADALLVHEPGDADAELRRRLGVPASFRVTRTLGAPYELASGAPVDLQPGEPLLAVAGIARPERFFDDLEAAGWRVSRRVAFRDHHPFNSADVARLAGEAAAANARLILTTAKDAIRFEPLDRRGLRIAVVPLRVAVDPQTFPGWLAARLRGIAAA
jgi:tetraacyldisaccharide 4'-kinase